MNQSDDSGKPLPQHSAEKNSHTATGTTFKEAPHHLKNDFLDWIRKTGEPESFWALCRAPLSKREPYIIISKFEVELKKRPNRDYVPCANCRPEAPKFLGGRLIYAVRLKRLFLIGHECADKRINQKANKEFIRRAADQQASETLMAAAKVMQRKFEILNGAKPAAEGAERLVTELRRSARPLAKVLALMRKTHGDFLVVSNASEGGGENRSKDVKGKFEPVATIIGGAEIWSGRLCYSRDLRHVEQLFEALQLEGQNQVIAARISKMSTNKKIKAVQMLARADRAAIKLVSRLLKVRDFFTARNFAELSKWGKHPLNNHRTLARFENGLFTIADVYGSDFKVNRWPLLESFEGAWPIPPA